MLTTTRLLLKKQTHNDNVGRWDVPLNWNFQAIDDDIAALALVLTGSTTGAWSVFQGFLDDYTASKSSTLGANATASLNGRLNYDQERNLVDDPTWTTGVQSYVKGRGNIFNSKDLSIPSNWWSYEGLINPFTVTLAGSTFDIGGGISIIVVLNGVKYKYNRPLAINSALPFPIAGGYNYPVFACTAPSATLLALDQVFIDGQTSRSSIPAVYGKGTATIGTSTFTVAVNGGHAISDADAGEADWKPKAGDTLEVYTVGSVSDRYKILTVAGNDITIVGKFPRTIAASDWNVMDYRQCNFVVLPDMSTYLSTNAIFTAYGSEIYRTSMIHVGIVVMTGGGGGGGSSAAWYQNNTSLRLPALGSSKTIVRSFKTDMWAHDVFRYVDTLDHFYPFDLFKGVTFFISVVIAGRYHTIYNPTCTPIAAHPGVPCFNLNYDEVSGHLIIGRVQDITATTICQYYTSASATAIDCDYAPDVVDWGFIVDLDI